MKARGWSAVLLLLSVCLGLGACGTKQTLEEAVKCGQVTRQPDGTWSSKGASLDYLRNGTQTQSNYAAGVAITQRNAEDAELIAVLDKKCAAKP